MAWKKYSLNIVRPGAAFWGINPLVNKNNPDIILADEPTGNLDSANTKIIMSLIKQLVKKYNCDIVPVYIERNSNINFTLHFYEPLNFEKGLSTFDITSKLNLILEKMIIKNPDQWIWSHDRWK